MKRYAMIIEIKPEKIAEYKKLHAAVWPEVLNIMRKHHIKNYSIYLREHLLFGYLEYHGNNYSEDMQKIARCAVTQQWWKLTDACQQPLPSKKNGEWWVIMEEIFHMN
jgi:L-rhamnose mutarotase